MTAGPVGDGKIPNMFCRIICDPGKRSDEKTNLGMFYTALSRATTLGDDIGRNSAIYFTGDDYNEQRVRAIGKLQKSNEDYKRVHERRNWVNHLKKNTKISVLSEARQEDTIKWATETIVSDTQIKSIISAYTSSKKTGSPTKRRRK